MLKKSFSDFEKVEFVLAGIKEGVVIKDYCNRHGISRSSFYSWKKAVLQQLSKEVSRKK
jgi:transposase-like protein